jgi:hypothetical protein
MRTSVIQSNVQFKLKDASIVLGVSPKDFQKLVQFGVLRPRCQDCFFVFGSATLLQAKAAFYLKESLGNSVPLLARFRREIFKEMPVGRPGQARNISILSRPLRGKEAVCIEVPVQALAAELEAQIPATQSPRVRRNGGERNQRREEITRSFAEAVEDLKGITEQEILDEI